jgi:undecaprenyl-diphosphatase
VAGAEARVVASLPYDLGVRRVGVIVVAAAAFLVALALAAARVGERAGALSNWQALALGVVQGATELLPISSSGHLIVVPWLARWRYLEQHDSFNNTFDVALHAGTLVAVLAYFWDDVTRLVAAWARSIRRRAVRTPDERVAWFVIIATIPAAAVGAAGESFIEKHLGEPWQIAILLAVFALVLFIADRTAERRDMEHLSYRTAFLIGVAQTLALLPGVSRSGVSISAGRFLGLRRDAAARFSFLLLIPIVFGAALYKAVKDVAFGTLPPGSAGPFAVGMIAAAVTGLVAIWALLGYVRRNDYSVFVIYRLLAAAAILILITSGVRPETF